MKNKKEGIGKRLPASGGFFADLETSESLNFSVLITGKPVADKTALAEYYG